MKLTVRCRSGLRIDFEGSLEELERFDGFLAELARLERDRLAPAPHDAIRAAVASPHVVAFEPVPTPSPPMAPGLAAEPDGGLAGEHDDEAFVAGIDALSRAALAPAPEPEPEPAPPVVCRQQAPHEGRVIGVEARARMDAEREERNARGRERILALVAEHGPVSYSWVADQLVKNRRDTAALMRDMTLAGELAETDAGGYYDVPDRDDQALAA